MFLPTFWLGWFCLRQQLLVIAEVSSSLSVAFCAGKLCLLASWIRSQPRPIIWKALSKHRELNADSSTQAVLALANTHSNDGVRNRCFHSCTLLRLAFTSRCLAPHLAFCACFTRSAFSSDLPQSTKPHLPSCQQLRAKAQSRAPDMRKTSATECEYHNSYSAKDCDTDSDSVTSHNQQQCRILRLPAELHNIIYVHVLGGNISNVKYATATATGPKFRLRQEITSLRSARKRTSNTAGTWDWVVHFLALTATCRQIRSESALLPFALNNLNVGIVGVSGGRFQKHTDALNIEQRASVRGLDVTVTYIGDLQFEGSGRFCRRL